MQPEEMKQGNLQPMNTTTLGSNQRFASSTPLGLSNPPASTMHLGLSNPPASTMHLGLSNPPASTMHLGLAQVSNSKWSGTYPWKDSTDTTQSINIFKNILDPRRIFFDPSYADKKQKQQQNGDETPSTVFDEERPSTVFDEDTPAPIEAIDIPLPPDDSVIPEQIKIPKPRVKTKQQNVPLTPKVHIPSMGQSASKTDPWTTPKRMGRSIYDAIETHGNFGLVDTGETHNGYTLLTVHVPKRNRGYSIDLRTGEEIHANSIIQGRAMAAVLSVGFITRSKYYSPGQRISTCCIGVPTEQWTSFV